MVGGIEWGGVIIEECFLFVRGVGVGVGVLYCVMIDIVICNLFNFCICDDGIS